jgi:DNA-directed RNA polymerase
MCDVVVLCISYKIKYLQNEERKQKSVKEVTLQFSNSAQMWCIFPRVIQINTNFANFAGLYFPHFTTFRNQTLQFY